MPKFFSYPNAQKIDAGDDFHGTWMPNPYQWLEDPESAETQAFIAAQNALTKRTREALSLGMGRESVSSFV